jgi:predicted Zn finger-like uncharacterized protein
MIEVQCTSCHTRYRIDEQVLPEGLPTFKCSRCGHVFSFDPRKSRLQGQSDNAALKARTAGGSRGEAAARETRMPETQEPPRNLVGRAPQAELSSPFPDSMVAGHPDPSEPPEAETISSRLQAGPIGYEEPVADPEQSASTAIEPQSPPPDQLRFAEAAPPPQEASSARLKAKQEENSYSEPFTGEDSEAASGEHKSFDFTDEEPAVDQVRFTRRDRRQSHATESSYRDSARWEVGEDDSTSKPARSRNNDSLAAERTIRRPRRRIQASEVEPEFTDDTEFVDEDEAPVYNRTITHSARFFLSLIVLVAIGFGALTVLIHGAPSSWSVALSYLPVVGNRFVIAATPAKLVALRDVHAVYQHNREGHNTLVISGTAENVGTASLSVVQLTAALRDAQHRPLASQAVYCGNSVSAGMVSQMTPHEIEFYQKLEPAKTFALEPSASCRFVAVFMNPPDTAQAYDISVSQAIRATSSEVEEPTS